MSRPQDIPPDPGNELKAVESALGSLTPAAGRLDRDRVMFRAGQAQGPPRRSVASLYVWPALAASLAVVAVGEGAMLAVRPSTQVVERVVYVPRPAAPTTPETSPAPEPKLARDEPPEESPRVVILSRSERPRGSSASAPWPALSRYVQLRQDVLKRGLDALPEPPPLAMLEGGEAPESSRELLRGEIDSFLNPGNPT